MRRCSANHWEGFEFVYIGDTTVHEDELQNIPYRWENEDTPEEQFQVLYNGEWRNAQSIDFDFND